MRQWVGGILVAALAVLPGMNAGAAASFPDIPGDHWGLRAITKMSLKGVVRGYLDGTFQPGKTVNRLEATIFFVRVLGLEESTQSFTVLPAELLQAELVPDWAKGYVGLAIQAGILSDADLKSYRPIDEIKRYEVAVWAVRALGLGQEAAARNSDALDYIDAVDIPVGVRGYVKLAAEKGLMRGDTLGSFRPWQPVTRAEMAAILDRIDVLTKNSIDRSELRGVIQEIPVTYPASLRIKTDTGADVTLQAGYTLDVYRNGLPAYIDNLAAGDQITVQLGETGRMRFVEATVTPVTTLVGTVTQVPTANEKTLKFTDKDDEKKEHAYPIHPDVKVTRDGESAKLEEVMIGDEVRVQVQGDQIVELDAKTVTRRISGMLSGISLTTTGSSITLTVSGKEVGFTLNDSTVIRRDGETISLSDLQLGDYVTVRVTGNRVTRMDVDRRQMLLELSGVITSRRTSSRELTIAVTDQPVAGDNDARRKVQVSQDGIIVRRGQTVSFSDLEVGDRIMMAGKLIGGVFQASALIVTYTAD